MPVTDPFDPRIGDLIVSTSSVPASAEVVCVLIGVPQDLGVIRNNGRPGAAEAPSAIRAALGKLATSKIQDVVDAGRMCIADHGDVATVGRTLEQIHDEQHDVVARVVERGHIPIVLGGGHDCAWPTIRAFESVGKEYGVVNIDAHADVRPLLDGVHAHSGSPFRQMIETAPSHLLPGGFVEFGLQGAGVSAAHLKYVRDAGMHVVMLDESRMENIAFVWERAYAHASLSGRAYVSLDMDAFASAYAPGVSAPAADGFTPHEIGQCLRTAASRGNLAAFDVVEMNPTFDVDGRTAKLAALMISEVLTGLAITLRR
ncbi:MAG: formimidoylglutamase [Candidatus Kapabacteria bacterium]|nr:formimidoylglutamase [Candidatus Kapabacteria bacterium]